MHQVGSGRNWTQTSSPRPPWSRTPCFPGDAVWQGPARAGEAQWSLQGRGSHHSVGAETELTAHVADLSLGPWEAKQMPCDPKPPPSVTLLVCLWLRPPEKYGPSYRAGHSRAWSHVLVAEAKGQASLGKVKFFVAPRAFHRVQDLAQSC